MKLDIVFVTFNSQKWVDKCLNSIIASNYDLSNISLLFCDNGSTDKTVELLNKFADENKSKFNQFSILESKKNLGFGRGNNKAAKLGQSENILFLNIDTEVFPDTLLKLEKEITSSLSEVGALELRQIPYEHPKYYDPYTGYVSWASGACIVFKRDVFKRIRGFDSLLFMYAEDVEISWRIRKLGYKIKYLPNVAIHHYSYATPNEFKQTQYIYSLINNLYIRYKYGNIKDMIKGNIIVGKRFLKNYLTPIVSPEEDKKIRKIIFREYIKVQFKGVVAVCKNIFSHRSKDFKPKFILGFDYESNKEDPFYTYDDYAVDGPLVSIVVRTCNRPQVLRETLISIRKQIYKNLEIILVEDGPNYSEGLIIQEFGDLKIKYRALGKRTGRSVAGNIGLSMASGQYINFLDDDDLFYPEHVLVLVNELQRSKNKIVFSTAFETAIQIYNNKDYYEYEVKRVEVIHKGAFNRVKLFGRNITPIQAVMFHRNVFEVCGGFDETIDALEDWDLWIKYAISFDWLSIQKTTSLYRVPYLSHENREREKFLISTLEYVINKYDNEEIKLSVKDIYNLYSK